MLYLALITFIIGFGLHSSYASDLPEVDSLKYLANIATTVLLTSWLVERLQARRRARQNAEIAQSLSNENDRLNDELRNFHYWICDQLKSIKISVAEQHLIVPDNIDWEDFEAIVKHSERQHFRFYRNYGAILHLSESSDYRDEMMDWGITLEMAEQFLFSCHTLESGPLSEENTHSGSAGFQFLNKFIDFCDRNYLGFNGPSEEEEPFAEDLGVTAYREIMPIYETFKNLAEENKRILNQD